MNFPSEPTLKANLCFLFTFSLTFVTLLSVFPLPAVCRDGCCKSVRQDCGTKSPFQRRKPKATILMKKQVKFTDESKLASDAPSMATANDSDKEHPELFTNDDDPLR